MTKRREILLKYDQQTNRLNLETKRIVRIKVIQVPKGSKYGSIITLHACWFLDVFSSAKPTV